jgi:hypothetical protein
MRWYRDHANGWTSRIEDDTADRWLVYAYARDQGEVSRAAQLDARGEREAQGLDGTKAAELGARVNWKTHPRPK